MALAPTRMIAVGTIISKSHQGDEATPRMAITINVIINSVVIIQLYIARTATLLRSLQLLYANRAANILLARKLCRDQSRHNQRSLYAA